MEPGKWKGRKNCRDGMAVCSMDLKIEKFKSSHKSTRMTGARFRCCIAPETFVLISEGKIKYMRHGNIDVREKSSCMYP